MNIQTTEIFIMLLPVKFLAALAIALWLLFGRGGESEE